MTKYEAARSQALQFLDGAKSARDQIRKLAGICVASVNQLMDGPPLGEADIELLVRELEAAVSFQVGAGFVLDDNDYHKEWLPAARSKIRWNYWERYRRYLLADLPAPVVSSVDKLTDKILERLEDPRDPGPCDRRGMVVGHVQSGKTGNFVGLICKAADAGYKVIIVLSGLHDDLRSQTQLRIDKGFLGYSSATVEINNGTKEPVGVGKLSGVQTSPTSLTAYEEDFSRAVAKINVSPRGAGAPIIMVVKKNKSILTNIISWLLNHAVDRQDPTKVQPITDSSVLIIDDEADQGSLNTKVIPTDDHGNAAEEYDVTAINGRIRQILSLFEKKAYVGYTATPFANVFVHPDAPSDSGKIQRSGVEVSVPYGEDLFPRSFIIALEPPENYVGAADVFGLEPDPEIGLTKTVPSLGLVETVSDYQDSIPDGHKGDHQPDSLPDSLKYAIKCFFLVCASRLQRGQGKEHNSMLVHVTRYIKVQERIKDLVMQEVEDLKRRIRYGDGNLTPNIFDELRTIWDTEFLPKTSSVQRLKPKYSGSPAPWSEIEPLLVESSYKIVVKMINGQSADALDYQRNASGASVIAVGGDKLSRGLTLEGLSISYFLRASKMYDTLMQMGRWFGYRDGYVDLCRIFTTQQLFDWYAHIAIASEELRLEFQRMTETLGKKPKDYGLKVRGHPSGLLITSMVKMRQSTTLKVSYDGRIAETTVLDPSEKAARQNVAAVNRLLDSLEPMHPDPTKPYIWNGVSAGKIIEFLSNYRTHPDAPEVNSDLLAHYIRKRSLGTPDMLTDWTVVVISSQEKEAAADNEVLRYPVALTKRKNKTPEREKYTVQRLLSPNHEAIGLDESQLSEALRITLERWETSHKEGSAKPSSASGPSLRRVRTPQNGLLLIYPLDSANAELQHNVPVIGIGISFPGDKENPSDGVEYEANMVYMKKLLQEDES